MNSPRIPDQRCTRKACRFKGRHPAGAHHDPRSDHYDGLSATLAALPYRCRPAAQQLAALARREGWNERLVNIVLHELATEIHTTRLGGTQ